MEAHCAGCHELSFDPRKPQKQLPHGSPEAVYDALEAHFVKLAFSPESLDEFERRRLPGQESAEEGCDKDYECAKEQALRETGRQFSQRGCVTCHQVSELEGAEGAERWQVLPVKINHDWYADARFDHESHLTQSGESGDALCIACHSADTSSASSDILMPDIAQCSGCHSDQRHNDRVALDCVSCHDYHRHSATGRIMELMEGAIHGEF
jgi:predicted CXXCH cytochrome family protein